VSGTLVMGVGNILLSDEGVGVRTVLDFERKYALPDTVDVLDGGTAGIELLRHIAGRGLLLMVDAMDTASPPGDITRFTGETLAGRLRTRISPHQLGLSDLLAAAALTGETPAEVVLYGIQPESIEPGLDLSPPVEAARARVVERLAEELRLRGVELPVRTDQKDADEYFWQRRPVPKVISGTEGQKETEP